MKILITGGMGYVGKFLCNDLIKKGYEIGVITNNNTKDELHFKNISIFPYSGKIEELKAIFEEWKPNKIVHLAADISKSVTSQTIDKMLLSNIILPAQLLQLSDEYKVQRFVNISTFSTSTDGQTYSPQTYYAATKKATEDLVIFYSLHSKLSIITLCFYDIYGPNQPHKRFLNAVIHSIKTQTTLHMSHGEQEICFLHVYDAVDAIIHALDLKLDSHNIYTYCVYGKEIFKIKDIPNYITESLSLDPINISNDIPYRHSEIMNFKPPFSLLENWHPKTLFKTEIKYIYDHWRN